MVNLRRRLNEILYYKCRWFIINDDAEGKCMIYQQQPFFLDFSFLGLLDSFISWVGLF